MSYSSGSTNQSVCRFSSLFLIIPCRDSESTAGRLTHMHIVRYYQATWSCAQVDVIREAFALPNQKAGATETDHDGSIHTLSEVLGDSWAQASPRHRHSQDIIIYIYT